MDVYYYTGGYSHPFFREQIANPPAGISYIASNEKLLTTQTKAAYARAGDRWYQYIQRSKDRVLDSRAFARLGIPQIRYIRVPRCDVVFTRHLLWNRVPWILQLEDVTALAWYRRRVLDQSWARHVIQEVLSSDCCRAILGWARASVQSMESRLDCSGFRDKMSVLYPAIRAGRFDKPAKQARENVRFLFIAGGSRFYAKGGFETLLAFDRLSRKHRHISLSVVAYPPDEVRRSFAGNERITFSYGLSHEQMQHEYEQTDVFVLPTHVDPIVTSYLEAFSYGVPCIGSALFGVPEMITDGVTGWLLKSDVSYYGDDCLPAYDAATNHPDNPFIQAVQNPPETFVELLMEKMETLAVDRGLRLAMSQAAFEEVVNGRFSVQRRNEALKCVLESCVAKAA